MAIESYQPKLPLDLDNNDNFIMLKTALSNVKQKLKMVILTNPGEKLMDPLFGVGIYRYLFEPTSGIVTVENQIITLGNLELILSSNIKAQVYKYCQDTTVDNVIVSVEDSLLKITIEYSYRSFATDTLTLTIGG